MVELNWLNTHFNNLICMDLDPRQPKPDYLSMQNLNYISYTIKERINRMHNALYSTYSNYI